MKKIIKALLVLSLLLNFSLVSVEGLENRSLDIGTINNRIISQDFPYEH